MNEKKEKRVLNIELDENVKKVSITGLGDDENVVMKEELDEDELDQATGGSFKPEILTPHIHDDDEDPLPPLSEDGSCVIYNSNNGCFGIGG